MKLNVFIVKGKTLIFVFCSFLIVILTTLLIMKALNISNEAVPTMSKPQFEEYLKDDLNGDGKADLLYITCKDNTYYMEAHVDNNTYFFNTKNALGQHLSFWPLSVKLIDLNNDSIPEIITQSSFEENPISHTFLWNSNEFKDILHSKTNFIGVLNSSNKNPVILLSSISDSSTNLYTIKDNELTNIPLDTLSSLILNTITTFINNIEESNPLDTLELFSKYISEDEKSNFYNLKNENYKYSFQDCFLEELPSPNSSSNEYLVNLNFKRYIDEDFAQVNLTISLAKIENNLKITSFKIN
ncbi:MAG: VCBS repeat-containing protein [Clostridium perfringens]|nr:VCBS repeat-containing protein [Clostridium perfringens]